MPAIISARFIISLSASIDTAFDTIEKRCVTGKYGIMMGDRFAAVEGGSALLMCPL